MTIACLSCQEALEQLWRACRMQAGASLAGYAGSALGRDALTAADRRKAAQRYVALVAAGKGVKLWDEALVQQIFLGGPEFVERMQALVDLDPATVKDIPRHQRHAPPKPIQYYLGKNKGRDAGIIAAVRDQ